MKKTAASKLRARPLSKARTFTIKRASEYSGLSVSTLYALAAKRSIKVIKAGRRSLVVAASLDAYIGSLPEAQIGPATPTA